MKKAGGRRHILNIPRFSLLCPTLVIAILLGGCVSPYRQGAGKFDTVIIDAGHGGHDRGGRSVSGSPEKVLALDTARRLAAILRSKGFRVVETRTRDVFVPLESRTAISNSTRKCIFVSIHYNWAPRRLPVESKSITSVLDLGASPPTSFDKPATLTRLITAGSNETISTYCARTDARLCFVSSASFPTP
jgi:N-acetylmuramoyl-L-alanine amidase